MKILSISLDNSVLNTKSALAKRTVEYGDLVEKYCVVAPNKINCKVELSEKVQVYGVKSVNKILGLINIVKLAKKLIKREQFDIITAQDQYYLALIGFLLSKRFKIGLEIQVHGFEKYYGLRKLIAKFVLPRANAVRAVSQRLKKRLMDEFGVDEGRITVVPIYADTGNLKFEIGNLGNEYRDKFIFLTVGRLVPVKNIEMQIKAIKNLKLRITNYELRIKDLELWIVGDGPEMGNLKLEIRNLGLENNIKLFGWQSDVDEFYGKADAFLLTSNSEGWGMAVIEAGSYGLPIIMTDVGCAGEVVHDGESGIVIPVGDQKKLEEAMMKLIQDRELRKRLGENARQAVIKLPSKDKILELYKESWGKAYFGIGT